MDGKAGAEFPGGRRYNAYVDYLRGRYGSRLQKVVIDAGFTCPNRDGKLGYGGCTFCDNAAFHPAYSSPDKDILLQIDEGLEFHKGRYRNANSYLAYFQAYSNTYGSLEKMKEVYCRALSHPAVCGIVIGTRPDCVDEEKLDFLEALGKGKILEGWEREILPDKAVTAGSMETSGKEGDGNEGEENKRKECSGSAGQGGKSSEEARHGRHITAPVVIVEYGIESCYDATLRRVNRGHDFETAGKAVRMTAGRGIETGAHFMLGLPGETREMMMDGCAAINSLPLTSVKFHQLQIVRGTAMEKEYERHPEDFCRFTLGEYIDFFTTMLERLKPELSIERFAGEIPPRFVTGTPWGLVRNAELVKMLERRLEELDTWQGRLYNAGRDTAGEELGNLENTGI